MTRTLTVRPSPPAALQFENLWTGGTIVRGIVPANGATFEKESVDSLAGRGLDWDLLLSRSILSPATRCLVNPDREAAVEKACALTTALSPQLMKNAGL